MMSNKPPNWSVMQIKISDLVESALTGFDGAGWGWELRKLVCIFIILIKSINGIL